MNLLALNHFDDIYQPKLSQLLAACSCHESISTYYPGSDALRHYLLFEDTEELISILAVIQDPNDNQTLECLAYTRPDMRKRGYFTYLLDHCVQEFPEADLIFPVYHGSDDALAAMSALDADCLSTEYRMERLLADPDAPLPAAGNHNVMLSMIDNNQWVLRTAEDITIGRCQTTASGAGYCLHDVEIEPDHRGKGYATDMMSLLFSGLNKKGAKNVFLHVSDSNRAAVSLYKKTGFRITETMSYYLY